MSKSLTGWMDSAVRKAFVMCLGAVLTFGGGMALERLWGDWEQGELAERISRHDQRISRLEAQAPQRDRRLASMEQAIRDLTARIDRLLDARGAGN